MEWKPKQVEAGGERAVGAGGDVKAAATGDHSTAMYTHVENQYVQQLPEAAELSPEETDEALRRYSTRIRETYGRLDLDVLIPTEEGEHPPVGLDEVFVAPTVRADPPPVELPRDIRQRLVDSGEWPSSLPPGLEREALERARRAYADRPARDVLEVLADSSERRIVLLGDPGAGKSTLARHVALTLTQEVAAGDPLEPLMGRVPLVVELREYAAGEWRDRTLEDFLKHLHGNKGMAPPVAVTERLLAEGRAVVVFDGLDELFDPAAREQVSHRIADFAGRYGDAGVRVVVTSRVIGYRRGVLERAGFAHYMIQDLSKEQIARFAGQWYATAYPRDEERAALLCRRLTDAVGYSRPVGELAGNPLLLTILAIIGRRRELPRDRQGVYRHAVAVLVAHWDEHAKNLRAPTDVEALSYLGDEDRHELLRLVARRMQDGDGGIAGNHIHQDELLDTFKEYLREQYELPVAQAVSAARTMVRQFRERNFILSHYGGGVYGFVHRAFLEYLAAEDIDRRYTREREWTQEEFIERVFVRHAEDPAWHEVLLLLVGRIGERDAAAAIDRLLEMHRRCVVTNSYARLLALSVRALAEVRRIGALSAQSRAVVDGIIAALEGNGPHTLTHVVEEISAALRTYPPHWSGRPPFLRWFHLCGQFSYSRHAGMFASALYQGQALAQAVAVHSDDFTARKVLLEMLAARWGTERGVQELLGARLLADPDEEVRGAALELLFQCGENEAELSDLIRDRSVNDPSLQVRALALHLRSDSEAPGLWAPILELLDSHWYGDRPVALDLLARYRAEDPVVQALLSRLAVEDPEGPVRDTAIEWMIKVCDDEIVQELLRELAIDDPDETVRQSAMSQLVIKQGDWRLARRLAVEDDHWFVRSNALYALREVRGEEPDTWELARHLAVADRHGEVRQAACDVLVRTAVATSRTDTWEILRDRLSEDPGDDARRTALAGLARLRTRETETRALVREHLVNDPDVGVRFAAAAALCDYWSHEPSTWELVFDRLKNEPADNVRHEVLDAMRHCPDAVDGWAAVRERASEDSSERVRGKALTLLATDRGDDAATRELIRARAVADPGQWTRALALRWWAVHETDDRAAGFLRDRAIADPQAQPRIAALQSLAFGWPAHPQTLPLLRERAETDPEEEVREASARALAATAALAPLADQLP
ncbi:HEAT repeat-containing protein [Streptomyces sp. cf386]|uniref:HEAT repeat domain-containing protein n=1 Tax=Streptomyces sp. cf386 TaxID=1761904 RepID=UPI00089085FE|nr:HEAT repeat domain-containing protein [Streptomyces sp. cf386]SDN09680.1 HEAT repeat-containing protein [Streptomyces sp. cf386]